MTLKLLFTITTIVAALFALGFLLTPSLAMAPFGVTLDGSGVFLARLYGAVIAGYGVLTWIGRTLDETTARRVIVPTMLTAFTLEAVVGVLAVVSGLFNPLGLIHIIAPVVFAILYGYFLFKPSQVMR